MLQILIEKKIAAQITNITNGVNINNTAGKEISKAINIKSVIKNEDSLCYLLFKFIMNQIIAIKKQSGI